MTHVSGTAAPRRAGRTFLSRGEEHYHDTGRRVDEQLGTHVVLWIVEDAEAWAQAVEAEGDAQVALWPKNSRYIGEHRRAQAYESATRIRAEGTYRSIRAHYPDGSQAHASVADLRRSHPNPGVRYEVAPIDDRGACPRCHTPTIHADGTWWHHTGRYPTECAPRRQPREPEPERQDGEFEISNIGMTCGYCNQFQSWPEAALGYVRLTGYHLLGVHKPTNTLVVLAEGTTLTGATTYLPHHCAHIPADLHQQYAPDSTLHREEQQP